jgi:anthranilate synthase/aminodeoxychorismate synthase-like glutamine amidotransferase
MMTWEALAHPALLRGAGLAYPAGIAHRGPEIMLLVIDNYDSFTYNLVQFLWELGAELEVVRNDERTVPELMDDGRYERILISPGPCSPSEAGISVDLVRAAGERRLPLMGVCLGHQSIGQAFGGSVVRAGRLMHGKTSAIDHDGKGLFSDLPSPFTATRYHSLVVDEPLPDCLVPCAWSADQKELMALRHRELPIAGVQFHPESFLTEHGHQLLRNFLEGRL